MLRIEIDLSVLGQSVVNVTEMISHALSNEERLNDAVVHRILVEEADA